jgi:hypothetical protein
VGGAKSYDGKKAWPSISYSMLSGSGRQFAGNEVLFSEVDKYVKIKLSVDDCEPFDHILFDTYSILLYCFK